MEELVPLPHEVGKLSIKNRHVYEQEAAGVSYRYGGDLVYYIDVFVYPVREEQRQHLIEGDEQSLLTDEFSRFRAELEYAAQQGWYQSVEPVEETLRNAAFPFTYKGESLSAPFIFARANYAIRKDGVNLISFARLTEFNGYFVKVRLTHEDYPGLGDDVDTFTEALLNSLYNAQSQVGEISVGAGERKKTVVCMPGTSMLECLARSLGIPEQLMQNSAESDSNNGTE